METNINSFVSAEKQIINSIEKLSGSYTPYVIFTDWVKMMAISIQNSCTIHNKLWDTREKLYLDTVKKYNSGEVALFCKMHGLLWQLYQEYGIYDYLGDIYMRSGAGSKMTGQFFTPFHVSELCAIIRLKDVKKDENIKMNEPSTGGGGLILATAKVLCDKGINYQRCLDVVARDLDWNGVYMTYVQLSMIGIKAVVIQGDTLAEPEKNYNAERFLITPAKIGAIL